MPKISIIIPVYNAQSYLQRCLDSVCNQTLKDIEIICVDDFSCDQSPQILAEYGQKYPHLKITRHSQNQGESAARNTGLALAKGEYLGFVDNDDEIDLDFYEKLYEKAKAINADIAKGQAIEIGYTGHQHFVKPLAKGSDKFFFAAYWWTAIYKRSLIEKNNISFSTHHLLGGDLLFLNQAIIAAKNVELVDGVYYHYHRREDSGDSKHLSAEKIKSALDIYQIILDNFNIHTSPQNPVYNFTFHHFILGAFYLAIRNDDEKVKRYCAKATADMFEKCHNKNGLQIVFSSTTPHLFAMLQDQNLAGIEEVLIKCKTRMEIIALGLRARIKSK